MSVNPTAAYRAQNGITQTGSFDPVVVGWIKQAAQATGASPSALLATALQESGAQRGRVGDAGTSFGPFQFHIGGALGSHPPAWANSYDAVLNRAHEFARLKVQGGGGAAAVQRPADRALYARGVDALMARANAILGLQGGVAPTRTLQSATPGAPGASAPPGGTFIQAESGPKLALDILNAKAPAAAKILYDQGTRKIEIGPPLKVAADPSVAQSGVSPNAASVIAEAKKYLGTPYVWGGTTPKGFDCSGFLQYVWAQKGVKIPRTTYQQVKAGVEVPISKLQPGDAIFFGSHDAPHHVGMYIGHGQYIQSPHTGDVVKISNLNDNLTSFAQARRFA